MTWKLQPPSSQLLKYNFYQLHSLRSQRIKTHILRFRNSCPIIWVNVIFDLLLNTFNFVRFIHQITVTRNINRQWPIEYNNKIMYTFAITLLFALKVNNICSVELWYQWIKFKPIILVILTGDENWSCYWYIYLFIFFNIRFTFRRLQDIARISVYNQTFKQSEVSILKQFNVGHFLRAYTS